MSEHALGAGQGRGSGGRRTGTTWASYDQMLGLYQGYKASLEKQEEDPVTIMEDITMNIFGDLEDLEQRPLILKLRSQPLVRRGPLLCFSSGCCQIMETYISHDTWNSYQSMLRINNQEIQDTLQKSSGETTSRS